MKHKAFAGIMALLLMTLAFSVFPVPTSAQEDVINVGVIGPNGWPQFDGMQQGAEIARDWINDMSPGGGGGITVGGTTYTVQLHVGDENPCDFCLPPTTGSDEMRRLITVENCKFIFGGFRTDMVFPMREVAMDYKTPFFICGASTNELVDCGTGTCGACVRCDYNRYRYVFRITPNFTTLAYNLAGFLYATGTDLSIIPLMAKMYGNPVRVGVLAEDFAWNLGMYAWFTSPSGLGPNATCVYSARTPYGETNFVPYLDAMHAAEVRLIILLYSMSDTIGFMFAYNSSPIKAVPLGINEKGLFDEYWPTTGGACEYEALLATVGYRTPICPEVNPGCYPYTTQEFWDLTVAKYGTWPIYHSWFMFDGLIALHDVLEAADPNCVKPYLDCDTSDGACLIPFIEQTDLNGIIGKLKYTGPHPMGSSTYTTYTCGDCGKTYLEINPTMNGTLHDVFSTEFLHEWCDGYTRPLVVQWLAGKLEVVWPKYKTAPTLLSFWKRFLFPLRMWPYPLDLDYNGRVEMRDISLAARSFGSYPCHPRYDRGAALIVDDHPPGYDDEPVSMRDISAIARAFGTVYPLPVPY